MRFQGRVGKSLILPTGGEAALLGGQRYRFCPPYPRNLVVVLREKETYRTLALLNIAH
jgi:hypothetical protein